METNGDRFWKKLRTMVEGGVPPGQAFESLKGEFRGSDLVEDLEEAGEELGEGIGKALDTLRDLRKALPRFARGFRRKQRRAFRDETMGEGREGAPPEARQQEPGFELLSGMFQEGGTDLHLEPSDRGGKVRIRIDGDLEDRQDFDRDEYPRLLRSLARVFELDPDETAHPQDARIRLRLRSGDRVSKVEARITMGPSLRGPTAVVRITEADLGGVLSDPGSVFQDGIRDRVLELARRPYGLFVVTGPTGSGKTTTLLSLLAAQDRQASKVVTVGDDLSVQVPGVQQIPVRPEAGMGFPAALRYALRLDPDVIHCEEVRDPETAVLLMRAALTGHLVFVGLHAPTAPDAVLRLLDVGLEPHLLADSLIAVVGQRLVRRLSPEHRKEAPEARQRLCELLGRPVSEGPWVPSSEAPDGKGHRGRMAVQELLEVTPEVRRAISERADRTRLVEVARAAGYRGLLEAAAEQVAAGRVSLEEALRSCG